MEEMAVSMILEDQPFVQLPSYVCHQLSAAHVLFPVLKFMIEEESELVWLFFNTEEVIINQTAHFEVQ